MAHLERAVIFLALVAASTAAAGPLTITDAWIRATPPGVRAGAAYLTLANAGAADRLLGGTTPAARTVEVHTHVEEGGLHRMVRLAELSLPAGETVRLTPGGLHLMLVDVAEPLAAGASVILSLRFAAAGTLEIEVPVVDARTSSPTAEPTH
jgi:periplasmic copper chaperone A